MLATDILTQDHKEVLGLISKLQNVEITPGANADDFHKIKGAVMLHMQAEEEIYYPALVKHEEFSDLLEDSIPEHDMVREILAKLAGLEPSGSEFQDVLGDLQSAIEAHAGEEEDELFPKSIEILGPEKIEALGVEIKGLKRDSQMSKKAGM